MKHEGQFDEQRLDTVRLLPNGRGNPRGGWVNVGPHSVHLQLDADGNLNIATHPRGQESASSVTGMLYVPAVSATSLGGSDADANDGIATDETDAGDGTDATAAARHSPAWPCVPVVFTSHWEEGPVCTGAMLDLSTSVVFDIEQSDEGEHYQHLIRETISTRDGFVEATVTRQSAANGSEDTYIVPSSVQFQQLRAHFGWNG